MSCGVSLFCYGSHDTWCVTARLNSLGLIISFWMESWRASGQRTTVHRPISAGAIPMPGCRLDSAWVAVLPKRDLELIASWVWASFCFVLVFFANKANSILACTGESVASRLGKLLSLCIQCWWGMSGVFCRVLEVLPSSQVWKDVWKLECVEKLMRLRSWDG